MVDCDIDNATFYGDGREGENAGAFIDRISRYFLIHSDTISDDNTRFRILQTLFPRHSDARRWIDKVTTNTTNPVTTWESTRTVLGLRDAFEMEWPDVTSVEKRPHEKRAALLAKATELTEENMTSWVVVGGTKQMMIRVWVNAVTRLAHQIPDTAGLCIDDVKDRMPRSLRSHLAGITITSWTDFRRAIDELNLEQLLFLQAEGVRLARFEERTTAIRALEAMLRTIPASYPVPCAFPPQILQAARDFSSVSTHKHVPTITTVLPSIDITPALCNNVEPPVNSFPTKILPVVYDDRNEFMFYSASTGMNNTGNKQDLAPRDRPYTQRVILEGPQGENVRLTAVFDDGSMVGAIDSVVFRKVAHRLGALKPSSRWLRMANGVRVPSDGVWEGKVTVGGVVGRGAFEIFAGGGAGRCCLGSLSYESFVRCMNTRQTQWR
ncbi:hypothetical protein BDZ89DRAFT_1045003 [Hymenopellis radicata]|nr:hypothetical protein BDZ89DRAFT_1045003 [Hymenopellis radicata]